MTQSSRGELLAQALEDLLRAPVDVEGIAVITPDGLPMATALPPTMDEDRISAMAAALLALGEQAVDGLGRGHLEQVLLQGVDGGVHLMAARGHAVVIAIVGPGAKLGMVRYELRNATERIADAFELGLRPEGDH